MGCDIHIYLEKLIDGKWVMVDQPDYKRDCRQRNYARFAALSGVRGDGPKANGWPEDASAGAKSYSDRYSTGAHSHSFLPLATAAKIFADTEHDGNMKSNFYREWPAAHYFDIEQEINGPF